METNLNHEQSLALINEMICRAQNNVQKKGTYLMIYWGYVTALVAILHSVLLLTLNDPNRSGYVWLLMFPAGVISYFIERQIHRETLVRTHIDKIGAMVWYSFLISYFVFMAVIFTVGLKYEIYGAFRLITPVILTMVGMGQFVTACIYRSKIWYITAALVWAGAIICAFFKSDVQLMIFAACMLIGFVVPGHLLNRQAKKSHV